ncbi:putative glycoside hydrolase family 81 protein [Phaeoacremonium minimum UCRPA7]|uniref:glucan endo-1,3-beta-D-glucosidase n=1 Tax=Phaeoacremonium minimum (strain UCR-PA7) TaxID=1286976 RepID=R8BKJ4_PHAM7|nr:putative glycoside hydrolase family 81 protein [Phaeoacremonium minimum UCRPA7]EON99804.1 putative glycoside hydrolase family 81 protein [Phaeoacremonium minimum UCRPA7]
MTVWYLLLTALQVTTCQGYPQHRHDHRQVPRAASESSDLKGRILVNSFRGVVTGVSQTATSQPTGTGYGTGYATQAPLTATVQVITSVVPSGTAQILPSLTDKTPDTSGVYLTSLETEGHPTSAPVLTGNFTSPTTTLQPTTSAIPSVPRPKMNAANTPSANIFGSPISDGAPPSVIKQRSDHPVARLGIKATAPLETNKFYANFFLGTQTAPTYVHPFALNWPKGTGVAASWGMAISHVEASQRAYGSVGSNGAVAYYLNPINIQSFCISAVELGSSTTLTTDSMSQFSAMISLRATSSSTPAVQFPLVQGMGFVTAIYKGATPRFETGVFFRTVTKITAQPRTGVTKYKFLLEDGHTWYLYAYATSGTALNLQVINNGLAKATAAFYGIIQVTKDPGNGEATFDKTCGAYPTDVTLTGTALGARGTYTFKYSKAGLSGAPLFIYALPHHVESFDTTTKAAVTVVKMQTTTKGIATGVLADSWTMVEPRLPISMSFYPWSPNKGSLVTIPSDMRAKVLAIAKSEISQDMSAQSNLNSMYYSGKALAKFAMILEVVYGMLGEKALATAGLIQLKKAFARFSSNTQIYPLVYESAWGGVVSSATYTTGDSGQDFGNAYYNDHHFHYGYFVLTAAVIGHLDPSWLSANKAYVNTLVRDYANPSAQDKYFPVSRSFDWYHGHSWAHGLFETYDGKDQESSSEDTMAAYAIKMWGMVSGDANMAARGNLMLSVLARSLQKYYLYTSDNTVEPSNFIANKVAGILFENKIDHTTYFGTNTEYIQGIHMLPLLPSTRYIRTDNLVNQEWATYFSSGRADSVAGGWRGILYGNYATVQPKAAYNFFASSSFSASWLDGGASQTWYLAYAAGEVSLLLYMDP